MTTIWDETKKQTAKMKDKPLKEKAEYFWEYYKIHTLIGLGALFFIISLVHAIATSKDYALSIVMVNSIASELELQTEEWINDLNSLIEFNPKKEEITIDSTISLGTDTASANSEYASLQKLAAMMSSKTIDIFVANNALFEQYAQNGYMYDLREILPADVLENYIQNDLVYYTDASTFSDYEEDTEGNTTAIQAEYIVDHHDPASMKDPIPVGLFVDNASTNIGKGGLFSYYTEADTFQGHKQEGVMGAPINTPRLDAVIIALQYFMEE